LSCRSTPWRAIAYSHAAFLAVKLPQSFKRALLIPGLVIICKSKELRVLKFPATKSPVRVTRVLY
jgi:hypothetical protein